MFAIPSHVQTQFQSYLKQRGIPIQAYGPYLKWLRYYLDFCQKYHASHDQRESLPRVLEKLQAKRQTEAQQTQAAQAITVYYDYIRSGNTQKASPLKNPSKHSGADRNSAQHALGPVVEIQADPPHVVASRQGTKHPGHLPGIGQDAHPSWPPPRTETSWKTVYERLAQTPEQRIS